MLRRLVLPLLVLSSLSSCVTEARIPTRRLDRAETTAGLPRFDTVVRVDDAPVLLAKGPSPAAGVREGESQTRPTSVPARPVPPKRPGERILQRADGMLTKFYSVRSGQGTKFGGYIARYCDLAEGTIEVLPDADQAEARLLRDPAPAAQEAKVLKVSDWIVVTGLPEEIERVDRFVNLYYASVPQIEIEGRIAEITSTEALDLGAVFSAERFAAVSGALPDRFGTNFPNQPSAVEGSLSFAATIQSESQVEAVLEFLKTRQGVDIVSNPRIAVRNGGRAEIVTGTEIPYLETQTITGGNINSTIKYKVVGVKLYVVPYLAGSDTIALDVEVEVSAAVGPLIATGSIPNPVISSRSAKTAVHVREGSTFVIGGLLASNQVETESKVPILGDIPLLGALFRSSFSQKQYTEVLFFLTPRLIAEEAPLVIPE